VRRSFIEYVERSGGSVAAEGGAVVDVGMSSWPLVAAEGFESGDPTGRLTFAGTVRFTAHFGMLHVPLSAPALEVRQGAGELEIADPALDDRRLVIATVRLAAVGALPGYRAWVAEEVALTVAGSVLFGGVYAPGERFDPLIAVIEEMRNR
jgi:hypothetical protein